MDLADLSATDLARRIRDGENTSLDVVDACIERMNEREDEVKAWVHFDPEFARAQANKCDTIRAAGVNLGPLHGVPVGIKDIIDTDDMPTEYGTPLHGGHQPMTDANLVTQLKAAGAVIMGKTVTTELAVFQPGKTTNPHNAAHTPGGSSSGSAAAVATGMAPLAIGTQTNGSVIRPASYCGVLGFKPSHGAISRTGVLTQSSPFDTIGVFARSVEDVALITGCISGFDSEDRAMKQRANRNFVSAAAEAPPMAPLFAFVKSPFWDKATDDTGSGFAEITEFLGDNCVEMDLPEALADSANVHRTIMYADLAKNFDGLYEKGKDQLSDVLREMIEEGQKVLAVDYNNALDRIDHLYAGLADIFDDYDAIITPAAPGEAPVIETTGNPIFSTIWTLLGVPAITLPLLQGENDLPIGVQLVGPRQDDGRLLRTANWLAKHVAGEAAG